VNINEFSTIDFCLRGASILCMRNILYSLTILIALSSSGCALLCGVPPQAQQTAQENADLTDGFALMMDAGTTTRVQEQKFIHANRRAWHAQNFALNDVPLPRDVEIWFKKFKLGLISETPVSDAPNTPR